MIKGKGKLLTPKPVEPCKIQDDHFVAPLPQHIDPLWEFDAFYKYKHMQDTLRSANFSTITSMK